MHTTEVLVVGGGLVGGTLACLLSGSGIHTTIVDRAAPSEHLDPDYDGRASAVALGTQRVLAGAGLWHDLAPASSPIRDIRVSDSDSLMFLHFGHDDLDIGPFGYMVENRYLRAALSGLFRATDCLDVFAPDSLIALERTSCGVTARLESGPHIQANLVIASDGKMSQTRTEAGIGVTQWSYPQSAIVCTIAHEKSHEHIAHERFLPAGPFAVLPLRDNRSNIVWTAKRALAPAIMALSASDFHFELSERVGGFLGAIELAGPKWCYPLSLQFAARTTEKRLALAGDAAHAMHPIAGQGLNMGLRDAAALAEVLFDAHRLGLDMGSAMVLDRYARWRRFDNTLMLAATDALNRLFSNDVPPLRLARDIGLATINRVPPVKRFFMRNAMGLVGDLPRLMRGEALG